MPKTDGRFFDLMWAVGSVLQLNGFLNAGQKINDFVIFVRRQYRCWYNTADRETRSTQIRVVYCNNGTRYTTIGRKWDRLCVLRWNRFECWRSVHPCADNGRRVFVCSIVTRDGFIRSVFKTIRPNRPPHNSTGYFFCFCTFPASKFLRGYFFGRARYIAQYIQKHLKSFLFFCVFRQSLHCAISLAAQCIVIGPVFDSGVCNGRAVSVTTITRNCVHRSSPNWVCRYR